jgi:hypothetical protein
MLSYRERSDASPRGQLRKSSKGIWQTDQYGPHLEKIRYSAIAAIVIYPSIEVELIANAKKQEDITMQLVILNASAFTSYGSFEYRQISPEDGKLLIRNAMDPAIGPHDGILSGVGHQSTAEVLTELLGVEIPMNRIRFSQEVGQDVIVFKLKGRVPEGANLSREEIEAMGYNFGLLTRKS